MHREVAEGVVLCQGKYVSLTVSIIVVQGMSATMPMCMRKQWGRGHSPDYRRVWFSLMPED